MKLLRLFALTVAAATLFGGGAGSARSDDGVEERLKTAVLQAVSQRNGYAVDHLQVTLHNTHLPDAAMAADRVVAEVPEYDDAVGAVTLKAFFKRDGETLAKVSVPAHVAVFDDAPVTTHRIKRHDVLRAGDFKIERIDITNLVKWVVTEPDSVIGKRATRTITPGTVAESRWLAEVPLVLRGDKIVIACGGNGVSVTGNAVALEDGYRDQEITVRAEWANRILRAVVVDAGTVAPVH